MTASYSRTMFHLAIPDRPARALASEEGGLRSGPGSFQSQVLMLSVLTHSRSPRLLLLRRGNLWFPEGPHEEGPGVRCAWDSVRPRPTRGEPAAKWQPQREGPERLCSPSALTQGSRLSPPPFLSVTSGRDTCLHRVDPSSPSPESLLACPSGAARGQHLSKCVLGEHGVL